MSTTEYSVLFILLCVGALAVWTKLSTDLGCQLQAAELEFAHALGAKADEAAPDCERLAANDATGAPGTDPAAVTCVNCSDPTEQRVIARDGRTPGGARKKQPVGPWINDMLKVMCPRDKAFLADMHARGVHITAYDRIYFEDPYYNGKTWATRHFEAGGTTSGNQINMIRSGNATEDAATIYHEGVHTGQPSGMAWRDQEYEAYAKEDAWRLARGLPASDPSFRKSDASGKQVTNISAIKKFVDKHYPGVTTASASGGAPDQCIGRTASGQSVLRRADGSTYTRAPRAGDSYPAKHSITEPPGGIPIDMAKLQCP